jgi:hypothetical protein
MKITSARYPNGKPAMKNTFLCEKCLRFHSKALHAVAIIRGAGLLFLPRQGI